MNNLSDSDRAIKLSRRRIDQKVKKIRSAKETSWADKIAKVKKEQALHKGIEFRNVNIMFGITGGLVNDD